MPYLIREISTHKGTDMLYVLVDYYVGAIGPVPDVTEEHIMQLYTTETRIVTDGKGNGQRSDGKFEPLPTGLPNPDAKPITWRYETVPLDVKAVILANLDKFDAQHVQPGRFKGDLTAVGRGETPIQRDKTDPAGILAKPEISSLVVTKPHRT